MNPKYRFLLAVLLTLFTICSQVVFGQTKEVQQEITVSNTRLSVELNYLQPEDCTAGSGSINISATGGSGNYSFKWTGPSGFTATSQNISGLGSGEYALEVNDGGNCIINKSFTVGSVCTSPCNISISGAVSNTTACNAANGTVILTVLGGSGSYNYIWYNEQFSSVASTKNLLSAVAGVYYVEVIDTNNPTCSVFSVFIIESPLKVNYTSVANTKCSLPFTGTATAVVTGGSGNYSYEWLYADAVTKVPGANLTGVSGGNYSLEVRDNTLNCVVNKSVIISNSTAAKLDVTSLITPGTSCSPGNGGVDIAVSNGSGDYNFMWYNQTTFGFATATEDLQNAVPATYSVYVTDNISMCSVYQQFIVQDQTIKPTFTITTEDNENCSSPFNGRAILVPSGNASSFSASWFNGNQIVSSSLTPSDLAPGSYGITLTDNASGCTASRDYFSDPIIIEDHSTPALSVNIESVIQNSSCGLPNGEIKLAITGENYSVTWTGPNGFSSTLENLTQLDSGQYSLKVMVNCKGTTGSQTDPNKIIEDIIVHNAVAPNSGGENKFMRIFNLPQGNRVKIFNRWGDLIFKVEEYDNEIPGKRFEGISLDGKGLPSGTYFYSIEFENGVKPLTGYLALKQS